MPSKSRGKGFFILLVIAFILVPFISSFAETITYTYDDLNRLRFTEYGDGTRIEYVYDEVGNREQKITTPSNLPPVANAGGPYTGIEGQAVIFDGSGSSDSDGTITLYEWDINNDGTYDYNSSSSTQNHTYTQQGTYTIKLRVTDNNGATNEATTTATISDTSPTADFTASPTTGPAPLTVNFTNNSTGYDMPLSYQWDFDNNGTIDSTVQNPSAFIYTGAGTYTVKLTVTDSDGSINSLVKTDYITVNPFIDNDGDGIAEDGDGSGIVGDNPCTGGNTTNCDDNCAEVSNPDQADLDSDGIGDACDSCPSVFPVRVGSTYYSTLQAAYDAAGEGSVIKTQDIQLIGNVDINLSKTVVIEGGYDCSYTSITGMTRLKGQMTVSNGEVTVKDFILEK